MSVPHVADAESRFVIVNITPDFCIVDGAVVPFDISRDLTHEASDYASTVRARGEKVLRVGSVIQGVVGNAGAGVLTGTSLGGGSSSVVSGAPTVNAQGSAITRHGDFVFMNGS